MSRPIGTRFALIGEYRQTDNEPVACLNTGTAARLDNYEATMLTHISIENFKGIRDRVELELKPITLLFGPNSAGKSTILHALLYAQEIFERHNLDADRTATGGPFIDLGGFNNMVHGREPNRTIGLGLRFSFDDGEWQDYEIDVEGQKAFEYLLDCQADRLLDTPTSAGVFLRIRRSAETRSPYVQSCQLQLDSVAFAEIEFDQTARSTRLHLPKPDHPLLVRFGPESAEVQGMAGEDPSGYAAGSPAVRDPTIFHSALEELALGGESLRLVPQEDALLRVESALQFLDRASLRSPGQGIARVRRRRNRRAGGGLRGSAGGGPGIRGGQDYWNDADYGHKVDFYVREFLGRTVAGILRSLHKRLRGFRYLGPVREIPRRNAAPPSSPDPARWSTGLGAWDHLQTCDAKFLKEVSGWLSDPNRLDSGVRLDRDDLIPLAFARKVLADSTSGRPSAKSRSEAVRRLDAFPPDKSVKRVFLLANESDIELDLHDVGIGFSQLLPVIVTALDSKGRLAGIEAPEYHLHPRLQAELGDLLIESAVGKKAILLVETHSEHLILRLQRRIRERAVVASLKTVVTADHVAVYHVNSKNGQTKVTEMHLDQHGDFMEPWPDDFFEIDFYERFSDVRGDRSHSLGLR